MTKLKIGDSATDFILPDHTGKPWQLAEVTLTQNALLVFNIGFA